jgi:hypothetical protein
VMEPSKGEIYSLNRIESQRARPMTSDVKPQG